MAITCTKCKLHKTRRNLVQGRGDIPADILCIGDAPNITEDIIGSAWSGYESDLILQLLRDAGLSKVPTYFTNCVLCFPLLRPPTSDEMLLCADNLEGIIKGVNPCWVILLGDVAQARFKGRFNQSVGIPHPSAITRAGGSMSSLYKEAVIKLKLKVVL